MLSIFCMIRLCLCNLFFPFPIIPILCYLSTGLEFVPLYPPRPANSILFGHLQRNYGFQDCVVIAEGGCTMGSHTVSTPEDTQPDVTTTTVADTTKPSSTLAPPPTVEDSDEDIDPDVVCPPGVHGNVPHPDRCDAFFKCTAGQAILLKCNEGFEFDSVLRVSCVIYTDSYVVIFLSPLEIVLAKICSWMGPEISP